MKFSSLFFTPFLTSTLSLFLLFSFNCKAQDTNIVDFGIEIQGYPTGLLTGIRATIGLNSHNALHFRAGHNLVRHRDLGKNDDERGGGVGFTFGYEHYFGENLTKWFLGGRTDLWFNTVHWFNSIGPINSASGTSNIIVLQPTLIGGYLFTFGNGGWVFAPSIGLGFEINVYTKGRDVGEGLIGLIGFVAAKRFGGKSE